MMEAKRLMHFVVDKQTDYGAWHATWPSSTGSGKHNHYHTGTILDCLADYMTFTEDHSYLEAYKKGLTFYREKLFQKNGAPRWMSNRNVPHDIQGSAAGILAFSRAARFFSRECPKPDEETAEAWMDMSNRVLEWALTRMYNKKGYFYYQKARLVTKRFTLMRWCNAWMCRAISQNLLIRQLMKSKLPYLTTSYRW